jgi:hypothetical protein
MNKRPDETMGEYIARLYNAAETLTQEQIDACAYVMGGSGCGWTKECIQAELDKEITKVPYFHA